MFSRRIMFRLSNARIVECVCGRQHAMIDVADSDCGSEAQPKLVPNCMSTYARNTFTLRVPGRSKSFRGEHSHILEARRNQVSVQATCGFNEYTHELWEKMRT